MEVSDSTFKSLILICVIGSCWLIFVLTPARSLRIDWFGTVVESFQLVMLHKISSASILYVIFRFWLFFDVVCVCFSLGLA